MNKNNKREYIVLWGDRKELKAIYKTILGGSC